MKKIILICAIALIVIMAVVGSVYGQEIRCAQRQAVLEWLAKDYKEVRQSVGLAASGNLFETYANESTGTWSILMSLPDGNTCVMADGTGYQEFQLPQGELN